MKLYKFHITFFLLISIKSYTQPNILWQSCIGGTQEEKTVRTIQDNDSNFVSIGDSYSNDGNVSNNYGQSDIWITKHNNSGLLIWEKNYGGSLEDNGVDIIHTTDNGYVFLGTTNSTNGDVLGNHGNQDLWVVKLDLNGTIIWQKCYGGTGYDRGCSLFQTSDGGYILSGLVNLNSGDVTGVHGNDDAWIVKLDNIGTIEWKKTIGGTSIDEIKSIKECASGEYMATGTSLSNNGDITGNHLTPSGTTSTDMIVVKLDHLGNIVWQKSLGGKLVENGYSVIESSDNNFVVAGTTNSDDGDVAGLHNISGQWRGDIWLVKLNALDGSIIWQKCLGGDEYDYVLQIIKTSADGFGLIGSTHSNNFDVTTNHGILDYWVINTDSNGAILWQKSLGGTEVDYGTSILESFDGTYVLSGATASIDGDVLGNVGSSNYQRWLMKLENFSVGIVEEEDKNVNIYPIPASNNLTIDLNEVYNFILTNIQGKVVFSLINYRERVIKLPDLFNGIYFATINLQGKQFCKKIIIKNN